MNECDIEDCHRPSNEGDYCDPHTSMLSLGITTDRVTRKRQKRCDYPTCVRPHKSKGFCSIHYTQFRAGISLTPTPYTSEWFRWRESLTDPSPSSTLDPTNPST